MCLDGRFVDDKLYSEALLTKRFSNSVTLSVIIQLGSPLYILAQNFKIVSQMVSVALFGRTETALNLVPSSTIRNTGIY